LKLPKWIQQHNKTKNSITDQKIDLKKIFVNKISQFQEDPQYMMMKKLRAIISIGIDSIRTRLKRIDEQSIDLRTSKNWERNIYEFF
jgi:hypothetical protein